MLTQSLESTNSPSTSPAAVVPNPALLWEHTALGATSWVSPRGSSAAKGQSELLVPEQETDDRTP